MGVEPTELLILSQAALPVYPLGRELYFVVPVGIEPTPTDFQSAAITWSATAPILVVFSMSKSSFNLLVKINQLKEAKQI